MLILEFRFPGGRFHATPWDSDVNEGLVEWPPSPYRLVRALVSTAFMRVREFDEVVLRRLITKLASDLPSYQLPRGTLAHTRHYVPSGEAKTGFEWKREKLFDTFVHVEADGVLRVVHPHVELDDTERALLDELLARTSYLGRAESWIEACVSDEWDGVVDAWPQRAREDDAHVDVIRLLAPGTDDDVARLRLETIATRRAILEAELVAKTSAGKKATVPSKAQLAKLEACLPATQFEAIVYETSALRRDGWSRPPGTEWISYRRRRDVFESSPRAAPKRRPTTTPTLVRFGVDSAVLPRFVDALSVAERVHQTLSTSGVPRLFGLAEDGSPAEGHSHAHILLEPDARGRIAGVSLYFRGGVDDEIREGLRRLRRVWGHGGHDLHLVLLGEETIADAERIRPDEGRSAYVGRSSIWQSRTPFVATRYPKASRSGAPKLDADGLQIGSPEHDLLRLLERRGFPRPSRLTRLDHTLIAGRNTRWLSFASERRSGEGRRGPSLPTGFRIAFEEPVSGPIVVGYGAHFGLGSFAPIEAPQAIEGRGAADEVNP